MTNLDPPTKPGSISLSKTVPAASADDTRVGPGLSAGLPSAGSPPPTPPPPSGPPPSNPAAGSAYSLPILIGVIVLALVGIGLLALGIYAVMKLNSSPAAVAGAITATRLPLLTQVVLVPTTTPAPSATNTPSPAPTATAAPATATSAASAAPLTSTVTITPTGSGALLTVAQGANVRSGPGTSYPVVGGIKGGDTVPVLGRDVTSAWFVISFKGGVGGKGWLASFVGTYNGDKSKLPVVAAPPTPVPPPLTATPVPAGNPSGGLVTGARGVSGMLNLCSSQVVFGVGERVCFVEWIKNNTAQPVPYGVLGVTAVRDGGGVQFQTSWSGESASNGLLGIDPGCIGPTDRCKGQWEDGMRLHSTGNYQLTLNVCFSSFSACTGTSGDWEVLSGAILITVQ